MAYFDHFSSSQATSVGKWFVRKTSALLAGEIEKLNHGAQRVLEIGPGKGDFCDYWRQHQGGQIVALEANTAMARALEARANEVVQAHAPPLPFASGCFDVVVASHVLEHMASLDQASSLIEEMTRVCRPGGHVVIVAPDLRAWRLDFWNADYTHNFVTTPRRVEQLFFNAGLKTETVVLHSGPFGGLCGRLTGLLARLLPAGLVQDLRIGAAWWTRLYKLKLTFLRNFLIAGRKVEG